MKIFLGWWVLLGIFLIGKYYPYKDSRQESAWAMLERLKALLDADGTLNPGQLGLNQGA